MLTETTSSTTVDAPVSGEGAAPSPVRVTPTEVHLFQIAYDDATLAQVEDGFSVLDNTANLRPDWYEYWPIRTFLREVTLDDDAFYGFFSTKFRRKTGLGHSDIVDFIRRRADHADVVLFSPQPDMGAFFFNVFEQGEVFDTGFIKACTNFLNRIGVNISLSDIVMDSRQIVFSNFFAARPAFWRRWLALSEALFHLCEGPEDALRGELCAPTTYSGGAQRKIFILERMASLLLASEARWRSLAYNTFRTAWSASRLSQYPTEAVIGDALKLAFREHGLADYVAAFANNRSCLTRHPEPDRTASGSRKPTRGRHSLASHFAADIPVLLPTFNNRTYTADMIDQLRRWGLHNIIIVDNASTSPDMVAFLDRAASDVSVIRLEENHGPHYLFLSEPEFASLPDVFCLSDPDLAFNPDMPPTFIDDLLHTTTSFGVGKAGLALDISDIAGLKPDKVVVKGRSYHVWEWEAQFWERQVGLMHDIHPIYDADIDTTFALYNKRFFDRRMFYRACRIAGAYTCRHIPWHSDNGLAQDEEAAYRATQKFSTYLT